MLVICFGVEVVEATTGLLSGWLGMEQGWKMFVELKGRGSE